MTQKSTRTLSPYEKTHLSRYGEGLDHTQFPQNTPVEYLTNTVEFDQLRLYVDPRVLIPRIETEELVELVWNHLQSKPEPVKIADVGTGSGAIALALTHRAQQKKVDLKLWASDISQASLEVARQNQQKINPQLAITWLESDLLSQYPAELNLDIIVANLPYIPHERISQLDSSVTDHEPKLALDGGTDGLEPAKKLFMQWQRQFPQADLFLELDKDNTEPMATWSQNQLDSNTTVKIIKDQFNVARFLKILV